MTIINARMETMEGRVIENGFARIADGKFTEISEMSAYAPDGGEVIDAHGLTMYPGFIDAHCHIGMWEDSLCF